MLLPYFSSADTETHAWIILVHVATAIFALVVAPVAMRVAKGGRTHRRWGRAYVWAMIIANVSAFALLTYRFNPFLAGVTVLSLQGALTGDRVLLRKQGGAAPLDWAISVGSLAAGGALALWALLSAANVIDPMWLPNGGSGRWIYIILPLAFGVMVINDALVDLRSYRQRSGDPRWWWYFHMERILGSYVALVTALMVQQVGPRLPAEVAWVVWVAPPVLGTVLITRWVRSYRRRFARADVGAAVGVSHTAAEAAA